MARSRRIPITPEEKLAKKIGKEVSDLSLDLEAVGKYLATSLPYTTFARALEILEAGQYYKEEIKRKENDKFISDTLW